MRFPSFFQSTRFLLGALVGASLFAFAVVVVVSTWSVHVISREEDKEVLEGYALIEGAHELQEAADREVILVRDHLLVPGGASGSDAATFADFDATLARLKSLSTDADRRQLLAEIEQMEDAYRVYAQRVIALARSGRRAEAIALFNSETRPRRAAWNAKLDELLALEHHYVAGRHDEVNRIEGDVKRFMLIASLLAIPTLLMLAFIVTRRVITPLGRLEEASRAIGDGDFIHRVDTFRHDEFGRVAEAFNLMVDRVSQGVNRLQEANDRLRRADRVKDEFLGTVSHELRTPLNFIKGFATLLANEYAGPLTAQQRTYVDNIETSTGRMLLLVEDLLDVAAWQAGKLTLEPEPCVYAALVEEVAAKAAPLVEEKRLTLDTTIESDATLCLDPRRIEQVLTNLIANAVKFTPAGGRLTVRVRPDGAFVRTEVSDTGIGIGPADQARLFQPFTQLDMSGTRKAGGSGLGLSISKALVEAHGGAVGVASTPNVGSTFWFTLPLEPAVQAIVPVD